MYRRADAVLTERLIDQFNAVVGVTEELLQQLVDAGSDTAGAARVGVERNLGLAKRHLHELKQTTTRKTLAVARATDAYVHARPWQAIGLVAGAVVVLAVVAELLGHRR